MRWGKFFLPFSWSVFILVITWLFQPAASFGYYWLIIAIFGLIVGLIFSKYGMPSLIGQLNSTSSQDFVIKTVAFLIGLFVAAMLIVASGPVMVIFDMLRRTVYIFLLLVTCSVFFMFLISTKARELSDLLFNSSSCAEQKISSGKDLLKILDTSAIIDGRIADLCKTGFLEGVLIIPHFVLNELQKIADSSDPLRRNRGRRGLDILNKIQKENQVAVRIFDMDYEDLTEVDTKLLRLARELEAKVVTNDFNLNKVAELYGVEVLNINELSNAIKPVVLPGEEMVVHVLRDGKEYGQGIGYLEDGTMIVVEGGKNYIGLNIEILVTSVLQTSAGRMIFAKPKDYIISKATSL
ncbi:MAG: PIN/TRAM domain-containing protein [Bacteroidota bacterium]